jgi:hypothetical protein
LITASHLVRENHRNGRRRLRFEAQARSKSKGGKGKGKEEEGGSTFLTTRHFRRWQQFRQKPNALLDGRGPPKGDDFPPEKEKEGEIGAGTSTSDLRVDSIVKAVRAKTHPPGLGSLGVRALHMKVAIGSPDAAAIKGRLDSGADITLMSEEYFLSLGYLPKPREGLRMRLYALTGEARVLGFTKFTMYARAIDGALISFEVEAYVVRNMRVPLLLGEDFQMAYELGTTRYSSGHCEIRIGQTEHVIPASSAEAVDLGFEVRHVHAVRAKGFLRRTAARRERTRETKSGKESLPQVLAADDVLIQAGSVRNVRVIGPFTGRKLWIVEKVVISTEDCSVLAAPTTWVNSEHPYIPVANPS